MYRVCFRYTVRIEAARALGIGDMHIVATLVIGTRKQEFFSAVALATAYAMGAAAPVMFTGAVLFTRRLPGLTGPFMSLPYHLYLLVSEGYSVSLAYGTAFVLIVMLLIVNCICRFALKRGK